MTKLILSQIATHTAALLLLSVMVSCSDSVPSPAPPDDGDSLRAAMQLVQAKEDLACTQLVDDCIASNSKLAQCHEFARSIQLEYCFANQSD